MVKSSDSSRDDSLTFEVFFEVGNLLFESGLIPRDKGPQLIVGWLVAGYAFILLGNFQSSLLLLVIGSIIVIFTPSAIIFDMNYLEVIEKWNANRVFWGIITILPVINIFTSVLYLKYRSKQITRGKNSPKKVLEGDSE